MSLLSSITSQVKIDDVIRLNSIFSKLGWRMHVNDEDIFNYTNIFNNFCRFLACLSEEEINIVLSLTEDYLHCPYTVYPKLMKKALLQIPKNAIDNCNSIFFIPLIDPKDIGKTKSSTGILYSTLHTVIPQIPNIDNKSHKAYENPNFLLEKHGSRKKSIILLLDDFIGSGDTAINALEFYNNKLRNKSDRPIVISLVAQQQGVNKIKKFGFKIYASEIRKRGISDSKKIVNKCKAIRIIRNLENRMTVSKPCRLGYKRTQALVSMIRTPNNTLPIYWWSRKPDGEEWNGIFKR